MNRVLAFGLVAALALTGCATLFSGTQQTVTINSNISGAKIYLDGKEIGQTPFAGNMRKGGTTLVIKADGYEDAEVKLAKTVTGVFFLNFLSGGLVGTTTDLATSAIWSYSPNAFHAELKPVGSTSYTPEKLRELAVKEFAMVHCQLLASELSVGGGEHVDALVRGIMQVPASEESAVRAEIASLVEKTGANAPRFGEAVAAMHVARRS